MVAYFDDDELDPDLEAPRQPGSAPSTTITVPPSPGRQSARGRLVIEALVNQTVRLGDRAGAANPGRKVMTLVSAMVAMAMEAGVRAVGHGAQRPRDPRG